MATKFRLKVAVLAVVSLGLLVAGPEVASAKGGGKKVVRIAAEEKQSEFLDLGTAGPSLGDELVISERLFRRGEQVGESGIVCVVTQAMPPYDVLTLHCVATLDLPKGQITLQGLIEVQGDSDMGPFRVAITGGTGAYRCACGEAVIRGTSDTESVYKLKIQTCKKSKKKRHKR